MSYDNLVEAIRNAIDKEALEHGNQYVTDEREAAVDIVTYDYEALMEEFQDMVGDIMTKDPSNGPHITLIIEKYLGKGKKISDTNRNQAEMVALIVNDIKEEILPKIQ